MVSQVVNALSTTSILTSSPNPSTYGSSVTFTDTVSASSGTPGGTRDLLQLHHLGLLHQDLARDRDPQQRARPPTRPRACRSGTNYVEAIYGGLGQLRRLDLERGDPGGPQRAERLCLRWLQQRHLGNPVEPFIYGTNGNDFIYAFGASYWIDGYAGNDCIDAGDGNNVIFDGNGNDGVAAGNGSDTVILGNGNDKVSLGNGSDGVETGNGTDTVTLGNGSHSEVIVGNGNDTITVGTGSYNDVEPRERHRHVTIGGSQDDIDGGSRQRDHLPRLGHLQLLQRGEGQDEHVPPAALQRQGGDGGRVPRHHHQLHGGVAMRRRASSTSGDRCVSGVGYESPSLPQSVPSWWASALERPTPISPVLGKAQGPRAPGRSR